MPVLVIVDAQKEYVTENRPFYLASIQPSLDNIKRLLAHAREKGWKVVHMRHQQNSDYFSWGSPWSEFIDGLEPEAGERSLEKSNFSCFSNREFQALADKWRHEDIIVAGYSAGMCCLSTMIDAHHRGHEFIFAADATRARGSERFDEGDMTDHIVDLMAAFGRVATTDEIIAQIE